MLIDTHFVLWYLTNDGRLTKAEIALIGRALLDSAVYVSVISFWEIAMLVRKQKIALAMPLRELFDSINATEEIHCLPLSAEISIEGNSLPGTFHPDPADRILVATARLHRIPLLTRDTQILNYGSANHVMLANTHAE